MIEPLLFLEIVFNFIIDKFDSKKDMRNIILGYLGVVADKTSN